MFGKTHKNLKQEAEQAFSAQKWKKALGLYLEAQKGAFDPKVSQRIADLYKRLGEMESAIEEYKLLARYYAREGFWAKAVSVCKLAVDLSPEDKEALQTLAELHKLKFSSTVSIAKQLPHTVDEPAVQDAVMGNIVEIPEEDSISAPTSTLGKPLVDAARMPLFADLTSDEFAAFVSKLTVRLFPATSHIVEEGDLGETMFLITEGRVEVTTKTSQGEKIVLGRLGGGEFFGEQSMLQQTPRSATVEAKTEVEAMELDHLHLKELSRQHPRILKVLEEFMNQRFIQKMLSRSAEFSLLTEQERVDLSKKIVPQKIGAETVVVEEGSMGSEMYFIKQGILDVFSKQTGKRVVVSTLQPGDFFGEVGMLTGRPRTVTVKSRSECELFVLTREVAAATLRGNISVLKLLQDKIKDRSKDLAESIESYREATSSMDLV